MANFITSLRLGLIFIVVALTLYAPTFWQLCNAPLILVIMILDGIDGLVARRCREVSLFGAIFDIAADRVIELTMWVLLAVVQMVPIWVALIFLTRGILVDSLRKQQSNLGRAPFSIMQTGAGKFLVASRTMRFIYGGVKLVAFTWLLFLLPAEKIWVDFFRHYHFYVTLANNLLVYSALFLCLLRGIPVLLEAVLLSDA